MNRKRRLPNKLLLISKLNELFYQLVTNFRQLFNNKGKPFVLGSGSSLSVLMTPEN